mmetsp:Transcript_15907/g.24535  ORF Transcript_15907/g.24535 Transcript_15907/m.24535 type:complete len:231 (-) Transcript_15907:7832-8524(-)
MLEGGSNEVFFRSTLRNKASVGFELFEESGLLNATLPLRIVSIGLDLLVVLLMEESVIHNNGGPREPLVEMLLLPGELWHHHFLLLLLNEPLLLLLLLHLMLEHELPSLLGVIPLVGHVANFFQFVFGVRILLLGIRVGLLNLLVSSRHSTVVKHVDLVLVHVLLAVVHVEEVDLNLVWVLFLQGLALLKHSKCARAEQLVSELIDHLLLLQSSFHFLLLKNLLVDPRVG